MAEHWMQEASADIARRGTEGICTGKNFGGPGCPPGSRQYALAQTFKHEASKRKAESFIAKRAKK